MNVTRFFACFLVLVMGASQQSSSGQSSGKGRIVNPLSFSVKGLRLHMTSAEARPIMEELGGSAVAISRRPCVSETISALREHREFSGEGQCIHRMDLEALGTDRFTLRLDFDEDLPRSPGTMRLSNLELKVYVKTDDERKEFFSAVKRKYGTPSLASAEAILYCGQASRRDTCRWGAEPDHRGVALYAQSEKTMPGVLIFLYDDDLASQSWAVRKRMINEARADL